MEVIARLRPLPLAVLARAHVEGGAPPGAVAITFDDGYADNAVEAAPLLTRSAMPATFFVATGFVREGRRFWWDDLARALSGPEPPSGRFVLRGGTEDVALEPSSAGGPAERLDLVFRAWRALLRLSDSERTRAIARIARWAKGVEPPERGPRPMTTSEVTALAATSGFEIGSHSVTHPELSALSSAEQLREAAASKAWLEEATAGPVTSFSYPFGYPASFTPDTQAVVAAAGYERACRAGGRGLGPEDDPFALPRVAARDEDGDAFARRLAALLEPDLASRLSA